jgi:hypothetical protein
MRIRHKPRGGLRVGRDALGSSGQLAGLRKTGSMAFHPLFGDRERSLHPLFGFALHFAANE